MHETATGEGTARQAVLSALRVLGLVCLVLLVPGSVAQYVYLISRTGGIPWYIWLLFAHLVLVAHGLARRSTSRVLLWLSFALWFVSSLAAIPERHEVVPTSFWAPGFWLVSWCAWAAMGRKRRRVWIHFTLAQTVLAVVDLYVLHAQGHWTAHQLAPVPWFFAAGWMVNVFSLGLLDLAEAMQEQQDQRRTAEQRLHEQAADRLARSEANRLLHDHVLHALHAVGRSDRLVDGVMKSADCRRAIAELEARPLVAARVEDLVLAEDTRALTIEGRTDPLPASIAEALAGAAREVALAARDQLGTSRVDISVTQSSDHWSVGIVDDGRTAPADRRGQLARSRAIDQLDELGGEASVQATPHGTRVDLRWPSDSALTSPSLWTMARRAAMRRITAATSFPGLVMTVWMAVIMAPTAPRGILLAALGVTTVVVGFFFISRLFLGDFAIRDAVALLVTAVLTWAAFVALAPDRLVDSYTLWIAWGCWTLVQLVVMQVRFVHGLATTACFALFMTLAMVARYGAIDWSAMHPVITLGACECVVTLTTMRVAGRLFEHGKAQARAVELVRQAGARERMLGHIDHYWSHRVTEDVVPFLSAVANQQVDAADPEVMGRAREFETMVRDELVLGPGQSELLGSVARLRSEGWRVTLPMLDEGDERQLDGMCELLGLLGSPTGRGQVLTLSATARQVAAVVLDSSSEQRERWREAFAARADGSADLDPEFVRLRLRKDDLQSAD